MSSLICIIFVFQSKCIEDSVARPEDIAADYYFSKEVLRQQPEQPSSNFCQNSIFQLWCHVQCKGDHLCVKGECYCLNSAVGYNAKSSFSTKSDSKELAPSFEDDGNEKSEPSKLYLKENSKPALRHQIAHFCTNLGKGRKCVMKCMKQGKPAFCGKDHRCYCGHQDSQTKNTDKQLDAFKNYKDMYEKYLGG